MSFASSCCRIEQMSDMNAIYARQSLDKKDSLSIEGQIKLCQRLGGRDAKVFQDKGYSGKNTKRPAFTELIEAVKAGTVKKIFVYRLDRFSRSIADFSKIWELLEQYGVEFQSVTEQFDTAAPIGRATLNIILVFAQLERETTAERVKDNYIHRFKLGAWPGGPAPYGYRLTKMISDGRRVSALASNEQSEVVKRIFEAYAKPDTSLRSIARALTENGVHGPRREAWDNVTLSRLLHSPLYVRADEEVYLHYLARGLQIQQDISAFDGVHACNIICRRDHTRNRYNSPQDQMLTVANHEGFISPDLWLAVQEKLSKNQQLSRANAGKYTWLTGLLKCGKCGYALKTSFSKAENRRRLICSGRSNFALCDCSVQIDLRELENYIADEIDKMLRAAPPQEILPQDKGIAAEILGIEQKIERLINVLAESSEIAVRYISDQIDALHKRREELMKRTKAEPQRVSALKFKTLDFGEKKLVASEFIDKILIDGKQVNIIWKI